MNHIFLFLCIFLFGLSTYAQNSYSLYFNHNKELSFTSNNSLYKTDQIYKIDCENDLIIIHNHYIKIDSYSNYCVFYFDDNLVGEFKTKRWINNKHLILYFIESKTYYYFYEE